MKHVDPDKGSRPMRVISEAYKTLKTTWHSHRRAQLIYASSGTLETRTSSGVWLTPPRRAVWIPPGCMHQGTADNAVVLRSLYAEDARIVPPRRIRVVAVDPLLDALLKEASAFEADYPLCGPEHRLMDVVLDRLPRLDLQPLHLPLPKDPRLARLTALLEAFPGDDRPLPALAKSCGMSERTAARMFSKEMNMTFTQWRQQLRLLKATQRLGEGETVTAAALSVGYSDVSAFITVFKVAFGMTPAKYCREAAHSL